jgi:hypothetical protein
MLFDEGRPIDCGATVLRSFIRGRHINRRGGTASGFTRPECFTHAMDSPDLAAVAAEEANAAIEDLDAEDVVVGFQVNHVDLYWIGERRIVPFSLELIKCFPLNALEHSLWNVGRLPFRDKQPSALERLLECVD